MNANRLVKVWLLRLCATAMALTAGMSFFDVVTAERFEALFLLRLLVACYVSYGSYLVWAHSTKLARPVADHEL